MISSSERSATRLQLGDFAAELLQLTGFAELQADVDLLPATKALLPDADLAAQIADRHSLGRLLQHGGDLLD